jgi:RNA polymerase-binding transcription factor DksA
VYSLSVVDSELQSYLEGFKSGGGNVSGLLNSLLKAYFSGGVGNGGSGSALRCALLEKQFEEFKEALEQFGRDLEELRDSIKHDSEAETRKKSDLIDQLSRMFDDIDSSGGVRAWITDQRSDGMDAKAVALRRVRAVSQKCGVSIPETERALISIYPDLAVLFN